MKHEANNWLNCQDRCNAEKNLQLSFYSDWNSLLPNMNWRDFTFSRLYFETADYKNLVIEIGIAFMGFHLTIEWYGR